MGIDGYDNGKNASVGVSECPLEHSESATGTNISALQRKAIPELLGKNFFIPDYQRGYRWEKKQILQLLEDIHNFFESLGNASFYCLQPIVVKKCSQEVIERYKLSSDLDNNTW